MNNKKCKIKFRKTFFVFMIAVFACLVILLPQAYAADALLNWVEVYPDHDITINPGEETSFYYNANVATNGMYSIRLMDEAMENTESIIREKTGLVKGESGFLDLTQDHYKTCGDYRLVILAQDPYSSQDYNLGLHVLCPPNHPPVLDAIGDKVVSEGNTLKFSVSATDIDNDDLTFTAVNLPDGAAFSNKNFEWMPNYDQAGIYYVTFRVSDGQYIDSETVKITVQNVNRKPVAVFTADPVGGYAPLLVSLDASQSYDVDADGNIVSYEWFIEGETNTLTGVKKTYTFTAPGEYTITLKVTDNEGATGTATKTINVQQSNRPPVLNTIGDKTVYEAEKLSFTVTASDPDNDILGFSASPLPQGAAFTKNKFEWTPNYEQEGIYTVTFKVTDSEFTESETITITVLNKNRPPFADFTFSPVHPEIYQEVSFDGTGSYDPDHDSLAYSWDFDNDGLFDSFEPKTTHVYAEPGIYPVNLEVADSEFKDSITKNVVVTAQLEVESINCLKEVVVNNNQSCSVQVNSHGYPIEGATVNIYYEDDSLYGECQTGKLGSCRIKKLMAETGSFTVYATAVKDNYINDTDKEPTETFVVYKERYDIKNLKVYADPGFEQESYEFFRGEDMYVKFQVYEMHTENIITDNIVTKATLVSTGHNTADLAEMGMDNNYFLYKLTPIPLEYGFIGDSQVFAFAFNFSDGSGGQKEVYLLIKNNLPEITPAIEDVLVKKGETFMISLSQHEYDLEDEYSAGDDLSWQIDYESDYFSAELNSKELAVTGLESGQGQLTLKLHDWDNDYDAQTINVNIWEEETNNTAPVLNPIGDKTVYEGKTLSFTVSAFDAENDDLEFSALNLPLGASFNNQNFEWTPAHSQVGTHDVTFRVFDGQYADSETITITVKEDIIIEELSADIGGPYYGIHVKPVRIDASNSKGDIQYYIFDYGDGMSKTQTTPFVYHTFSNKEDSYNITLTVVSYSGKTDQDTTMVYLTEQEEEDESTENTALSIRSIDLYSVYSAEPYTANSNDELIINLHMKNSGENDLDRLRVTVMIPELGLRARSKQFDLDEGDNAVQRVVLPLYDVPKGEYYVKILVNNADVNRIKYRYVIIS